MSYPSMIIKGNAIFDGTGREPYSGAVIIEDHKIKAVMEGGDIGSYAGPDTKILEYNDKLIMPGFNDCHTHMSSGAFLEDEDFCFNVLSAKSKEEALQMTKTFADAHPENEWIVGYMMNNLAWEDQTLPTRYDLDQVISDRPVALQLADMHTIIANTCAIKKVGYTNDTPDPDDGVLEKDEKGVLNGRFFDGAGFAFTEAFYNADDEVYMNAYRKFFQKLSKLGITATSLLSPFGVPRDPVQFYEKLEEEGSLTARVCLYPNLAEYDKERYDALYAKHHDGKIRLRGLKQLIDGVTSVYTAYLLEPYTNNPETCGTTSIELDVFHEQMMKAIADGRAVRIHTIGDKAIRVVLDYFEEAKEKYGDQGLRHVQEHIENVHPDDLSRFAELGIACGMQPLHMLFDLEGDDKEKAIGHERCKHAWPMRELLDAGTVIGLSSDFPVVEIEPMHEVYGAVTRQTFSGKPEGGWFPEQRITMAEALKAYTWGSAYVEGCEDDYGTLAEGKLADLIVLDRNLFTADPSEIIDSEVELTVFDGQVVYQK